MVGQRDIGPHALGDLAHRGHVALQVAVDLRVAEIRERPRLDPLVAVGHVDRQQPADVRAVDRRARRLAPRAHLERAAVPVAGRVDPARARSGSRSWHEQVDLVARAQSAAARLAL